MKSKLNRLISPLFSVLMAFVVLFSPLLRLSALAAETNAPPTNPDPPPKDYKYNVTITFGYMSFLYDFGVWDSGTFSYKANESSTFPSQATTLGSPGWYNFDGINNKITISCQHTTVNTVTFPFNIGFEIITDDKTQAPAYSGITMEVYEDFISPDGADWIMDGRPLKKNNGDISLTSSNNAPVSKDFYISFSGVPKNADGTQFNSNLMQKIGFLTLTIGKPVVNP